MAEIERLQNGEAYPFDKVDQVKFISKLCATVNRLVDHVNEVEEKKMPDIVKALQFMQENGCGNRVRQDERIDELEEKNKFWKSPNAWVSVSAIMTILTLVFISGVTYSRQTITDQSVQQTLVKLEEKLENSTAELKADMEKNSTLLRAEIQENHRLIVKVREIQIDVTKTVDVDPRID